MRLPPPKDLLPQPRGPAKPAGRRIRVGFVNNRTQKTAVNPLTRLASRSVMRRSYLSPHVEGPAATFDPSLDQTARYTACRAGVCSGITVRPISVGNEKQTFPDDP